VNVGAGAIHSGYVRWIVEEEICTSYALIYQSFGEQQLLRHSQLIARNGI